MSIHHLIANGVESSAELGDETSGELRDVSSAELRDEVSGEVGRLHSRARSAAAGFRRAEGELMEALIAVDRAKVHFRLGYASLFQYAVSGLDLSEAVAYAAISVARKAEAVPALREAIATGAIGLSKARKVVAVLDPAQPAELQSRWVEKAVSLSSRKLERAVAQASPRAGISERAVYKSEKRIELTLGISEHLMLEFRAAQDLVSSAKGNAASLEETLARVLELYLARKDPERRARRVMAKKGAIAAPKTDANPKSKGSISDGSGSISGESGSISQEPGASPGESRSPPRETITLVESSEQKPRSLLFTGTVGVRKSVPAATLHAVRLRDRNSCRAILPDGTICGSKRWLEIHHRRPVSEGGTNELSNLITYCRAHHSIQHGRLR